MASLFWRLRRATAIETGLLRMQGEILHAFRSSRPNAGKTGDGGSAVSRVAAVRAESDYEFATRSDPAGGAGTSRDVAISFLRLANLDNDIVDRLSRYEAALWRQLAAWLRCDWDVHFRA